MEEKQIAAILELIYKYSSYFCVSDNCKEVNLKYYLSNRHRELHGGNVDKIRQQKKWNNTEKDICRITNIVDFVQHASKSVVTLVNKNNMIFKDKNRIIGGTNYIIRREMNTTNSCFGLYRTGDHYQMLILGFEITKPEDYNICARKLIEWYNKLIETSNPCYIHSNGFDINNHEIDSFIQYVSEI